MRSIRIGRYDDGGAATLHLSRLNRHALVTGSTGSGKTVTLQRLAHEIAREGVAVVFPDVKGDLMGEHVPFALSVSRLGPDLMGRALGLSDAQTGVLETVDRWARETRRPLDTVDDFRQAVARCYPAARWSAATLAALDRSTLRIERAEGVTFSRDPFDPLAAPRGVVTCPDAVGLALSPAIYGAAVLALLESAYRGLPEIGDTEKPRLVLIIDEAHLLFREIPPLVLSRVESLVRLVRSRGVALVLSSQSVDDIPPSIASQLGTRIQHGLRAASRADVSALRTAVETLPGSISPDVVRTLPTGRALVSTVALDGSQTAARRVAVDLPDPVATVALSLPTASGEPVKRHPTGSGIVGLALVVAVVAVLLRLNAG